MTVSVSTATNLAYSLLQKGTSVWQTISSVSAIAYYRELTRAVGLASHGVGIGSFVYLRRIFERLIDEASKTAAKVKGWDPVLFQQSRMEEKIRLLKDFLPAFLVEQRQLYSILSKGIHALTETECLESFPIVRAGIELILDQKVAAKQQHDKMEEAKKHLTALQKKITDH